MTILKYLRLIVLALYWQLPQSKQVEVAKDENISREFSRKKRKKYKRKKQTQQLPFRQREPKIHRAYSVKPKDARFSDQRKLRRMFINL